MFNIRNRVYRQGGCNFMIFNEADKITQITSQLRMNQKVILSLDRLIQCCLKILKSSC